MNEAKAVVLCSGGLDSTTCLALALEGYDKEDVTAVSIQYGQKHYKELKCASDIAKYYGVDHVTLDLYDVLKFSNCPLIAGSSEKIPDKSYAYQIKENGEGMVATYVPFRNGLMLSAVASLAMSIYPKDYVSIYIGAHADDAAGQAYADCSQEFTDAMCKAIQIGTYGKIDIVAPFVTNTKAQIVEEGLKLKVPYELTWSCYNGGEKPCGKCGTCIDRAKAFEANGVKDPAISED